MILILSAVDADRFTISVGTGEIGLSESPPKVAIKFTIVNKLSGTIPMISKSVDFMIIL